MSSGYHGIASVQIENGSITFCEVWGRYARDVWKPIELQIKYMVQPRGDGNVHYPAKEVVQDVYLSDEELFVLVNQLSEYVAGLKAAKAHLRDVRSDD